MSKGVLCRDTEAQCRIAPLALFIYLLTSLDEDETQGYGIFPAEDHLTLTTELI